MADAYDVNKDRFAVVTNLSPDMPARSSHAVTPSDVNDVTSLSQTDPAPFYASALYIGVSGDVAVINVGDTSNAGAGTPKVYKAHPVGYLRQQVRRVMATNTTATNILALTH